MQVVTNQTSIKISGSTVSPLLITQARFGFHAVLKKKSAKLTYWKNFMASKINEKKIPKVTKMATIELKRITLMIVFSTIGWTFSFWLINLDTTNPRITGSKMKTITMDQPYILSNAARFFAAINSLSEDIFKSEVWPFNNSASGIFTQRGFCGCWL